jgi:hypothetical protein
MQGPQQPANLFRKKKLLQILPAKQLPRLVSKETQEKGRCVVVKTNTPTQKKEKERVFSPSFFAHEVF